MARIIFDEATRTFSVEDILDPVVEPVKKTTRKAKRSTMELLHDIFIHPKTREDRLRRRAAIGFAGSLLSAGLGVKSYIDKNNMQATLDDICAGKPAQKYTGLGKTLDIWKEHYDSVATPVSDAVKSAWQKVSG